MTPPPVRWPHGRRFAFTVFDDPDAQTVESGRPVYALLADLGIGLFPSYRDGSHVYVDVEGVRYV